MPQGRRDGAGAQGRAGLPPRAGKALLCLPGPAGSLRAGLLTVGRLFSLGKFLQSVGLSGRRTPGLGLMCLRQRGAASTGLAPRAEAALQHKFLVCAINGLVLGTHPDLSDARLV